jgi:leader peptidase (prepilin peptidase)/N-methyltransferase
MVPSPDALDPAHLATWGVYFGFVALLVVASYVDLRHRIVPDQTSIFAVPLGVLAAFLLERVGAVDWVVPTWREAVLGAALGGGFFTVTAVIARFLKGQEALGWGDVKLMAMIGAFLGPIPGVLFVMLLGSIVGSVVGIAATVVQRRRTYLPFAPPLAAAAAVYVLYGDVLVRAFLPAMAGTLD